MGKVFLRSTLTLVVGTFIALELVSFCALTTREMWSSDKSFYQALESRVEEVKLSWKVDTPAGNFDPVSQTQMVPGGKFAGLQVGPNGYISNGHSNALLNSFPDKPQNLKRVIFLGGSAAAGSGVDHESHTLPARLEALLNQRADHGATDDGHTVYQVLNFGVGGGYTGNELVRYTQYLAHLQPDVVVSLDGYNDAWNTAFQKNFVGVVCDRACKRP